MYSLYVQHTLYEYAFGDVFESSIVHDLTYPNNDVFYTILLTKSW